MAVPPMPMTWTRRTVAGRSPCRSGIEEAPRAGGGGGGEGAEVVAEEVEVAGLVDVVPEGEDPRGEAELERARVLTGEGVGRRPRDAGEEQARLADADQHV